MGDYFHNNLQANLLNSMAVDNSNSSGEVPSAKDGKFGGMTVGIIEDIDPTTRDDECASVFKAEKDTKKAQDDKDKQEAKGKLNALQKTKKKQEVQEQDQRNRRITKNTERVLNSISQFVGKELSATIQERSQKLFSGSESNYQTLFEALDQAALQKNCTPDKIAQSLSRFEDIAEQHNALQIVIDVWERKLTNLKGSSQKLASDKDVNEQERQQSQEELQQLIQELEGNLNTLQQAQSDLMAQNGARIEDSYKLAPLLREVSANYAHDVSLPPKSFNALILDKLLPLKGDYAKTFDCLTQGLIEGITPSSGSSIEHFQNNLGIVKKCLAQELQCCPNTSISTAILEAIRRMEKLETIQRTNEQVIKKLSSVVQN